MADIILTPIADLIIETLNSAAVVEIVSLHGAGSEFRKLESTLSTIRAVLIDAEKRQIREEAVRVWLQKLEDVLCDVDDWVDEVNAEGLRQQLTPGKKTGKKVRTFLSSNNQFVFRHKMAREIKTIRERFDAISADKHRFHFVMLETDQATRVRDDSHSFVDKENVVGRDKDRRAIVELLLDHVNRAHQEKVSVIPIVGMGGLGKTTLAQLVFNDERVQQHFDLKLWVCVSDDFSLKVLCEKIIKIITAERVENLEPEQLQTKLREQINGKRFLLVLDDVWNEDPGKWQGFKGLLRANCAEGSKIIVTARKDVVADIMGTVEPYYLGILDSEDSWKLFKKMAFEHRRELTNPNTVETAKKIVEKCKGLPLAISMIGSTLLRSRNPEIDWPSFLKNDLLNITQKEKGILSTLKLSYDYLPTQLKPCFAYCSLFPKDHEFDVQTLVTMWIAQGFIKSPNRNQNLEDVGYNLYFMDLVSRSFFQEAKIDELEMVTTCKMHDLVHDLATEVAGDKYALLASCEENLRKSVRHISFDSFHSHPLEEVPSSWLQAKRLRSFLFPSKHYVIKFKSDSTWDEVISNLKFLRTLDLHNVGIETVPDSIGNLTHLRYLDLSRNEIQTLPASTTKLVNLWTLKLNGCRSLCELPNEIEKLINLRHLELEGCFRLTHMPRGLSQLTNLQTLSHLVLGPCSSPDGLRVPNNLRGKLEIKVITSGRVTMPSNLRYTNHLRSLSLYFERGKDDASSSEHELETSLEGLQPHPNLRELTLKFYNGASLSSFLPTLTNLVKLRLINCSKCQQLPSLDQFHSLKEMSLVSLDALEYVTINEGDSYFSTPSSPSVSVLPSLQNLTLKELPNFRGWSSSTSTIPTVSASSYPLPKLTSLFLEDVTDPQYFLNDLMKGLASLKKLHIRSCPRLKYLSPHVQYLTSLEELEIFFCKEFEEIKWQETPALTSLRVLKLKWLPKLKNLPYLGLQYLTSLEELEIFDCEEFEAIEWPETTVLPSLRILKLRRLPKLKYFPSSGIQYLTFLEELEIERCEELQVSIDIDWKSLTSLRTLNFNVLPQLVTLPGGLESVTTLKNLQILACENFTALPDWIYKLCSLKTLYIGYCPDFKSVPGSISRLNSLPSLFINDKEMDPRDILENLDVSYSTTGPTSLIISKMFRALQLCNE